MSWLFDERTGEGVWTRTRGAVFTLLFALSLAISLRQQLHRRFVFPRLTYLLMSRRGPWGPSRGALLHLFLPFRRCAPPPAEQNVSAAPNSAGELLVESWKESHGQRSGRHKSRPFDKGSIATACFSSKYHRRGYPGRRAVEKTRF